MEENGVKVLSLKSVLLHIHTEERDKIKAARELSIEPPNTTGDLEYRRLLVDDGSNRVMLDRWSVVRDFNDTPVAFEGFIRVNTWRHQIE
jgi:hypothetical protein